MKILKHIFTDEYCEKVYNRITEFLKNGGMNIIFILAAFGILLAIFGHYGKAGFNWKWFVFFELPLYTFLGWAIFKVLNIWKSYNKNK